MLARGLVRPGLSFARTRGLAYSRSGYAFGDPYGLVVTPSQLHYMKSPSDLVILDASWHMPNSPRKADREFLHTRIPSARFLDIDRVASTHPLSLPHMMPDAKTFAEACCKSVLIKADSSTDKPESWLLAKLGISPSTHVIIYDTLGVFSSPRTLYMFRAFGHENSSILDGGLPGWQAHGGITEHGTLGDVSPQKYPAPELDRDVVKGYDQMVANAAQDPTDNTNAFYVLDARSKGRFLGTDPEPRPGLSSGHMPHAISLPFNTFLETHTVPEDVASKITDKLPLTYTRLRSSQGMLSALEDALGPERLTEVLEGKRKVVTSCGSGMTAAVIWLGLQLLGVQRVGLYDESWTGYAIRPKSKIVKGE